MDSNSNITNSDLVLKENPSLIFETGAYLGITFKVGPNLEEIKAHRSVLMSRSSVFATMFQDQSDPLKIEPIQIPNIQPNSFRRFLKYLYTEQFNFEDVENIGMLIPELVDILLLARTHCLLELVESASRRLKDSLKVDTCVEIFERTQIHKDLPHSKDAFTFIQKTMYKIITHPTFLTLNAQSMQMLLESDDLEIDEVKLFKGLLKWGKEESPVLDENMVLVPRSSLMPKLVRLIRYPLMKCKSFAHEVVATFLLNEEEVIRMFMYYNGAGPIPKSLPWKARASISQATIRVKFLKISETLKNVNDRIFSHDTMIRGFPWMISLVRSFGSKSIRFELQCDFKTGKPRNSAHRNNYESRWGKRQTNILKMLTDPYSRWNCSVEVLFKILPHNPEINAEPFTQEMNHIFNSRNPSAYFYMDMRTLAEKGLLKDDSIILEVEFKTDTPFELDSDIMNKAFYVKPFRKNYKNIMGSQSKSHTKIYLD